MEDWRWFLSAADEWFISYSLPPMLLTVKLFSIGHVVELYLKAANTKMTGDINRSIRFSHNIKRIWDDCKAQDPAFMPNYELRDTVFQSDFATYHGTNLSNDDHMHYIRNQEFYLITKHLPDLKYLGVPLKTMRREYSLGLIFPNDYWIRFIKELRLYLSHPRPNTTDRIIDALTEKELPWNSADYLNQLYDPPIIDMRKYKAQY